ncbi:MAG: aromatic ring-hydroxylating dioxygenase subunit alpha [Rhodobacterales bacterium]
MLSKEKNDILTQVSAGTPSGKVMRQYWIPAALSEEISGEVRIVPVTLMGELLVLFRNEEGSLGLINRRCPHRGVDLCYGRLEEGGLRCPFHGWNFAPDGQCLEQPGEPLGSTAYEKIKTTSYPVVEKNGIIFAFMGEGTPPAFPDFDCFRAPDSHVFAYKGYWNCNWLQALEVGIDPVHASFLHRFLEDEDASQQYGKQFRDNAAGTDIPITQVLREYPRPEIQVKKTAFGLRLTTLRQLKNGKTHVRVTNQIFPCAITIPMSASMNITQWHVPIDDESCYWYSMFTSFDAPVDKEKMRAQRFSETTGTDYRPKRNEANEYGFDPQEQQTLTYTGMGMDINVHDQWAVESQGRIRDRRLENLATTDKAIGAHRQLIFQAINKLASDDPDLSTFLSDLPPCDIHGPAALDAVAVTDDYEALWREKDAERRAACAWDAKW